MDIQRYIRTYKGYIGVGVCFSIVTPLVLLFHSYILSDAVHFILKCSGLAIFCGILSFIGLLVWEKLYNGRIEKFVSYELMLFLIFLSVFFIKLFVWIYGRIFTPYFSSNFYFVFLSSPLFFIGSISSFIFGFPYYIFPVLLSAIIVAFIPDAPSVFPFMVCVVSLCSGEWVRKNRGFNAILLGGAAGFVFLIILCVACFIMYDEVSWGIFISPIFATISTIIVSFITLPIIERLFDIVTDLKLLELASLDHPLLKQLLDKAPGTYNHSMLVGILAEAAAKEIGANPILSKVGGYFHDIGKLKNPKYFIENTMGVSMHEKLSPSMSRLIIVSHVKDGVELAKEYKLPKCVIDIIEQHHGTSLISYFYHKAKKSSKEEVTEEIYRYPGPKPRSKEAAIVMITDSTEAAVRSLEDVSPSKIKSTVSAIINRLLEDGQLDECDITLKEVKKVAEVVTKMLISIYHKRISYPEDKSGNKFNKRNSGKN